MENYDSGHSAPPTLLCLHRPEYVILINIQIQMDYLTKNKSCWFWKRRLNGKNKFSFICQNENFILSVWIWFSCEVVDITLREFLWLMKELEDIRISMVS